MSELDLLMPVIRKPTINTENINLIIEISKKYNPDYITNNNMDLITIGKERQKTPKK
jgi:hypothetical protein